MRIAMVSEHASPLAVLGGVDAGGQNVHVAALSRALAAAGHEVDVYTRRDDADLPDAVPLCPGVTVHHVAAGPARSVPKDDLLPYMRTFGDELAVAWSGAARPDVAHGHFWMSGLASVQAGQAVDVPVVQTFHALGSVKRRFQGHADTSPPGRVMSETTVGRRVEAIVATCSDEVTELARMGVPTGHVHVVPCGVDVEAFTPGAAEPAAGRPHRLLTVGRLVERKGVELLIGALALLPDAELWVAGGPPRALLADDLEAQRLLGAAAVHGVGARVRLLGAVAHDEVPELMRQADVVVAAPRYEPFGIVPVEAAACGRAFVGTAVGGLLDTVVDGRTGVLVEERDAAAFAAQVRLLLDDPPRRTEMGRTARLRAEQRYSWDRVAAATADVYAGLVGSSASEAVTAG